VTLSAEFNVLALAINGLADEVKKLSDLLEQVDDKVTRIVNHVSTQEDDGMT
jgi:hypothetical protein